MHVIILGKRWELKFVPNLADRGVCESPTTRGKVIKIRSSLKGEEKMDVLIHEIVHAAFWHIDEEYVERFASDLAKILTKAGYHE